MTATLWFFAVAAACGVALAGLPNLLAAFGLTCLRASRALRALHRQIEDSIDRTAARLLQL